MVVSVSRPHYRHVGSGLSCRCGYFLTRGIYPLKWPDPAGRLVAPPEHMAVHDPAVFPAAILGSPFDWPSIAISSGSIVAVLIVALAYFRSVERRLADII